MNKHFKTETIIAKLCAKLHCSELAQDLERVNYARGMLTQLQQMEVLNQLPMSVRKNDPQPMTVSHIQMKTRKIFDTVKTSLDCSDSSSTGESVNILDDQASLEEDECGKLSEDAWLGFFPNYEILVPERECVLNENKQCIELSLEDDSYSIEKYLHAGVRCFMLDLFLGTELEKQKLLLKLRECELKLSREQGFPVTTTLFALLSPRLQYTGVMETGNASEELIKGDTTLLTTKEKYTTNCSRSVIYVNAGFLIEDCRKGDFILVGPSIQLMVTEVLAEELSCIVMASGVLRSRLPVRFPARCSRTNTSLEELEDITYAHAVGITVLVSYRPGSQQYLNDLCETMQLLKCEKLRIFTRIVLNEYEEAEKIELDWIAQRYDGFLVDFSVRQNTKYCRTEEENFSHMPNTLNLCPASINFLNRVYNMKKPIILNPNLIAKRQLFVKPPNIPHVFFYPDKFIFSTENYKRAFYFFFLQNALIKKIPESTPTLVNPPYCDQSHSGSDSIARACAAASAEVRAKAIIVCSEWSDMTIAISHFRPPPPIIHVSANKSIAEYISLYHNAIFMNFQLRQQHAYTEYVLNAILFCMIFLKSRNILRTGENVILVYGTDPATKFCDKYLIYKFNEESFHHHLEENLFL